MTGNPALAFQVMFAVLTQMVYYVLLPLFNIRDDATYAMTELVTIPKHWAGFGIFMALLVLHGVLIITAVVIFVSKTEHSLLRSAWQAVAQISSSDTMHHASNMTDLEVNQFSTMNSCEDNEVVLKTSADSGRSQAGYRRETGEKF